MNDILKNFKDKYNPRFFDSFGKNRKIYEQAIIIVSLIEEKIKNEQVTALKKE